MQSYYFIKYDGKTTYDHVKKYSDTNAIICFDFEDSINNSLQKKIYRGYYKKIINEIIPLIDSVRTGLRINNKISELEKDLNTIRNQYVNSIFIPKIENPNQIINIKNRLLENNVTYDEIIPVIESKNSLSKLNEIIAELPEKSKKIVFGHCDYNLSINAFPFFHHNSKEYWRWINKLITIITPKKVTLINSAYLELDNDSFFKAMIHHLYKLLGDNFGQVTLTAKQSKIIREFNPNNNFIPFIKLIESRFDLRVPNNYAEQLIKDFERDNKNKGFTVLQKNKLLLSPHEYITAKNYLKKKKSTSINFTFTGGCFPLQYNILFEDLFHQKLKRRIENVFNIEFNINIIRYERFLTCLDKIKEYKKSNPVDILVFNVRPEPYLRLVKFYYRYLDNEGKLKHSLNIPVLKILNPEKFDILVLGRRFNSVTCPKETRFHKILIDLNYLVGSIFGNKKYAIKKYYNLVMEIVNYCKSLNIIPVILGPAYRSNTSYEPVLCKALNRQLKKKLNLTDIAYIECLEKYSRNNEPYFYNNGIHAKENFHELIAEKLYNEIKEKITVKIRNISRNIM